MQAIAGGNLRDLHGEDLRELLQPPFQDGTLAQQYDKFVAVDAKGRPLDLRNGSRKRDSSECH